MGKKKFEVRHFFKDEKIKILVLLSLLLVLSFNLLQINVGLDFADEGYLWYGVQQTIDGQTPIKDFKSYDPGRYYWSAFWGLFFGKGIISLRVSIAIFQWIGLLLTLLLLQRKIKSLPVLALLGAVILIWMFPRHKIYDCVLSIISVYIIFRLLEKPNKKLFMIAGGTFGLLFFFGRNHALYFGVAAFLSIIYIYFNLEKEEFFTKILYVFYGFLMGLVPFFFFFILNPSVLEFYIKNKILIFIERKGTNISKPIPFPWKTLFSQASFCLKLRDFIIGFLFLFIPLFCVYQAIKTFLNKNKNMLLFASSLVGLFYMHHAFSRADIPHLSQSIHPFLIGIGVYFYISIKMNFRGKALYFFGFIFLSLYSIGQVQPIFLKTEYNESYVEYDINRDRLWVTNDQAKTIDIVKKIYASDVKPGESILIAPHWPTMYAILKAKAPLYNTYFLFPEPFVKQNIMIGKLKDKKTNWILMQDATIDGRKDLKFSVTHNILYEYILKNYKKKTILNLPKGVHLFERVEK